jgi:hypothetical protein
MGLLGEAVLDRRRGHQADLGVSVMVVVSGEELTAERSGFEDRVNPGGLGSVVQRFELRLAVGVISDGTAGCASR